MGEAAPKDNSMEEILASIRRIISSDDETPAAGGKSASHDTGVELKQSSGSKADHKSAETVEGPSGAVSDQAPAPTRPVPQPAAQAGTLAGLAQQLRGTKGPEATEKVLEEAPGQNAVSFEMAGEVAGASQANREDIAEADDAVETRAAPKAASSSSAQSLADLAKSINQKIDAASREPSDEKVSTGNAGEMTIPEAGTGPEADTGKAEGPAGPAGVASGAPRSETRAPGSLADLAESLQTYVGEPESGSAAKENDAPLNAPHLAERRESGPDAISSRSEAENVAPAAAGPAGTGAAHGADKPEAFKEALVSSAASKAVSSSMERLKQATADLSQAQVEAVLRPLLKDWLDNNLPTMVEQMVQREIDRIVAHSDASAVQEDLPQSKSA